jgi:hypothetical protein
MYWDFLGIWRSGYVAILSSEARFSGRHEAKAFALDVDCQFYCLFVTKLQPSCSSSHDRLYIVRTLAFRHARFAAAPLRTPTFGRCLSENRRLWLSPRAGYTAVKGVGRMIQHLHMRADTWLSVQPAPTMLSEALREGGSLSR